MHLNDSANTHADSINDQSQLFELIYSGSNVGKGLFRRNIECFGQHQSNFVGVVAVDAGLDVWSGLHDRLMADARLVALAEGESPLREVMEHRFASGELEGHSFGNLLLAAFEESSGSVTGALEKAGAWLSSTTVMVKV